MGKKQLIEVIVVEGAGQFPFDMLRYDSCWPWHESPDSAYLEHHHHERRMVTLGTAAQRITPRRWESFNWKVVYSGDASGASDFVADCKKKAAQPKPPQAPGIMTEQQWRDMVDQDEHYLVEAIKRHLATGQQLKGLFDRGLSIEDCLNGRYEPDKHWNFVGPMYKVWNSKLGWKEFLTD